MEENLDLNNEINKEISDNISKTNSEEIKEPKSEVLDINGYIISIFYVNFRSRIVLRIRINSFNI